MQTLYPQQRQSVLSNRNALKVGLLSLTLGYASVFSTPLMARSLVNYAELRPLYQQHLPAQLSNQLTLGQIRLTCPQCPQTQTVPFFNLRSDKPFRTEKISLQQSYSAFYAFPNTHLFALVQFEHSVDTEKAKDSALAAKAFRHDCEIRQAKLARKMQQHPKLAQQYQAGLVAGRQLLEFSQQAIPHGELLSCTYYSLTMQDHTISQLLWLRPMHGIRIRMSLQQQAQSSFSTMEQFLRLRQQLIDDYQRYLQEGDIAEAKRKARSSAPDR